MLNLETTSLLHNFGAGTFNLTPAPYTATTSLLIHHEKDIAAALGKGSDRFVAFGTYEAPTSWRSKIAFIDFPVVGKKENSIFLPDTWGTTTEQLVELYGEGNTAFIVTTEYLASLSDPRPILLALKKIGLKRPLKACLIHTNAPNVRHWNAEEIQDFLTSSGFACRQVSQKDGALIFTLSLDQESYAKYLENQQVSPTLRDIPFLLLTTEDAAVWPSGGIGTYVKGVRTLNSSTAILFCDLDFSGPTPDGRTLPLTKFVQFMSPSPFADGLGILEIVKCALYLMPSLNTIEFQDYLAIGFRLIQAKKTGALPQNLWLQVFLHGSIDYLKYGMQSPRATNYSKQDCETAIKDSYIYKYADSCVAPSRYLSEKLLKTEFGYELNNLSLRKLPFDLTLLPMPQVASFNPIRRLVFIGKFMHLKGWFDFVKAVEIVKARGALHNIEEIVALAPDVPPGDTHGRITAILPFRCLHLPHTEFIQFTQSHRADSLFVVPSRGENYPFVILEQLLLGTRLIAYDSAGTPEVIDDQDFVARFLSLPTPEALSSAIDKALHRAVKEDEIFLNGFCAKIRERQKNINESWKTHPPAIKKKAPTSLINVVPDVSVVVSILDTPTPYIKELISSLQTSRLKPKEVIFVTRDIKEWNSVIDGRTLGLNCRLAQEPSTHRATVRNRGLTESKSPFTFFIDGADFLLPNTLADAWLAMQTDASLLATYGCKIDFTALSRIPKSIRALREGWQSAPIGIPEARVLSFYDDDFISGLMVRTAEIRKGGGWGETYPEAEDDNAFFSRLAWQDDRFSLIPLPGYLCRKTGIPRPKNPYFARRQLIESLPNLSRLDATILLSLMHHPITE